MRSRGCRHLQLNDFYLLHGALMRLLGFRGRIATFVRIDPVRYGPIGKFWLAAARWSSNDVVAVSRFIQAALGPRTPSRLMYDSVSLAEISTSPTDPGWPLVLFIGNFIEGKGQEHAVEAFNRIAPRFRSARLRFVGGDTAAISALQADERAAALATAAAALTARGELSRALEAYAQAVRIAPSLPADSPAFRALAIAGNNLSAALEEKVARTAAETEGMVAAARGGLAFWRKAGTWLEEERALYRLARSLLAAGQPGEAALCAQQCARICDENNAPAFERFFARAVLARALREDGRATDYRHARNEALDWFDAVPDEEREWCEADLAELAY